MEEKDILLSTNQALNDTIVSLSQTNAIQEKLSHLLNKESKS